MKKLAGFNLIELMMAVGMSAAIISMIIGSFSSLNRNFLFNINELTRQQNLRFGLVKIKRDLQNAGVFGSFSFHNQLASSNSVYSDLSQSGSCNNNDDWCKFDNSEASGVGVGIRSYLDNKIPQNTVPGNGYSLASNSDILRVQYGGNVSFLKAAPSVGESNSCITRLEFTAGATASKRYLLASSNHAYLLNLTNITPPNLILSGIPGMTCNYLAGHIKIESYDLTTQTINDPDQATLQLVNFYTKYYYVAAKNFMPDKKQLYERHLTDDGELSDPTIVADSIQNLQITYMVDATIYTDAQTNKFPALNNRYLSCTTHQMGNGKCNWDRITAINISLVGQADSTSGIYQDNTNIHTVKATIGWLW